MVHAVDTMGKQKPSFWGDRYSTLVKDHHDARTWTYAHKRKHDMPDVLDKHEHAALIDARHSKSYFMYDTTVEFPVKAYRSDNAGELTSNMEMGRRREMRIGTELTVPGSGHAAGVMRLPPQ